MVNDFAEIEEYVHHQRVADLIEKCSDVEVYPIAIPTYKNRKVATLLRHLDLFGNTPVYLIVEKSDYYESGYDKENFPANVKPILVTKEEFAEKGFPYIGIATKRQFIQQWMLDHNIPHYWVMDDDINPIKIKFKVHATDKATGQKAKNNFVSIEKCMKVMQEINRFNESAITGFASDMATTFYDMKSSFMKSQIMGWAMLYDTKLLQKHDIHFYRFYPHFRNNANRYLWEDVDTYFQCIAKNVPHYAVQLFAIMLSSQPRSTSSLLVDATDDIYECANMVIKYGSIVKIHAKTDKQIEFGKGSSYLKKVFAKYPVGLVDDHEIYKTFHEKCLHGSSTEIMEYLKEHSDFLYQDYVKFKEETGSNESSLADFF